MIYLNFTAYFPLSTCTFTLKFMVLGFVDDEIMIGRAGSSRGGYDVRNSFTFLHFNLIEFGDDLFCENAESESI